MWPVEEDGHLALLLSSLISGFLRACGRGGARLVGGSLRRKPGGPGEAGRVRAVGVGIGVRTWGGGDGKAGRQTVQRVGRSGAVNKAP